jgi:glycosyltransferase involved in cell wall biosynthesis
MQGKATTSWVDIPRTADTVRLDPVAARVTVVIPTFNRQQWLERSLASALAQSYEDICVLVCDNDSADDTQAIVTAFKDQRVVYVKRNENIGMFSNHVEAMHSVETQYFWILGDDNIADPNLLSVLVPALDSDDSLGMVHSAYDVIDDDGNLKEAHVSMAGRDVTPFESGAAFIERSLRARIRVCEAATVFRTSAVREAGYYDPRDAPLHDVGLLLRIASSWNVGYVDRPLLKFRIHRDALGLQAVRSTRDALADPDGFPNRNLEVKLRFIRRYAPDPGTARRWRSLALASRRRIMLEWVGDITRPNRPRRQTFGLIRAVGAVDPRVYAEPRAWGLLAMSMGGRRFSALASGARRWVGAHR